MPLPTIPVGPGAISPAPEPPDLSGSSPTLANIDDKVYQPLDLNTPIAEQRSLFPSRSFSTAFQHFKRQLLAQTNEGRAKFREEVELRITKDEAVANYVQEMGVWFTSELGTTNAAIVEERTIRATADSANAILVDTVTAAALGYEAAVLMKMEAGVAPGGVTSRYQMLASITAGGALYKTGIFFDLVPAGGGSYKGKVHVLADQFSIGSSETDITNNPFYIDGGVVYIQKAKIKDLSIETEKVEYNGITDYVITSPGGLIVPGFSLPGATVRSASITVDNGASVAIRATGYQPRPSADPANNGIYRLSIYRGGNLVTSMDIFYDDNFSQPFVLEAVDQPGNGTHSYSCTFAVQSGAGSVAVHQGVLSLQQFKR